MRIAAVLLVALAVTAGCGSSEDESAARPAEMTSSAAEPASMREAAPPLSGSSLEGDAITLGDFRGRPLLINVWSSW